MQQSEDLGNETVERRDAPAIQTGWQVLIVQHHRLVGPLLRHAGDADAGVFAEIPGVEEQPQPGFADLDESAVVGVVDVVVAHLAGHGPVTGGGVALLAAFHVRRAGPPQGQGQHDPGVARVGGDVERGGRRIVVGNAEGRAVGQQTAGGGDGDLAQRQRLPVQNQLRHAPVIRAQVAAGLPDEGFEIAILLLEVLGTQEHPLGPHNLAVPAHGTSLACSLR